MSYRGVIFDLDGVLCSTDKFHYEAWKSVADRLHIPFDEHINDRLRGVSRMESLAIILEQYQGPALSAEEKKNLAEEKNAIYKELLLQMTPADLSAEVKKALEELRGMGYRL
ncbi:HAD hydrolase-like protein, partial [Ruminococcaceae bacterium OttesenSCG-928-I18]|nr:HAD hydrolase-like protein [Ruminococcaceae bacterium OttesenSCG-928-I18]